MNLFDHIFVALIILGVPLYEFFIGVERTKKAIARDLPGARVRIYWEIIIVEWLVVAVLVAAWLVAQRSASDLGFSPPGGVYFWIGAGLMTVGMAVLLTIQRAQVSTPERRNNALKEINNTAPFVPRNRRELSHWYIVSLTAGICEEIVYRGFLIWYALQLLPEGGLGATLAVVLPALCFAIGHIYQGPKGMSQVFVVGLILGGVYVLTGSLWVPIITHALMDITGGMLSHYLHQATDNDNSDSSNSEEVMVKTA